jgi:hypothetical protein
MSRYATPTLPRLRVQSNTNEPCTQVVAAVSAIISAFHGGSDLLKHIKQKRRKARAQAQQDFEEKQLQNSLDSGELQIGLRYTQDIRELGDYVRVGDGEYWLDHCGCIRLTHAFVQLPLETASCTSPSRYRPR